MGLAAPAGARSPGRDGMTEHVEAAIGVVFDRRGEKVLICRRKHDTVLGGYWEFPGGKCEAGETAEACVRREVREEVGLEVETLAGLAAIEHDYPYGRVRLHPFVCLHVSGEAQCLAVAEARWVLATELGGYEFPAANEGLLQAVRLGLGHLLARRGGVRGMKCQRFLDSVHNM